MRNLRITSLIVLSSLCAFAQSPAPKPAASGGGLFACSEGGGTVRLLWMPMAEPLPAGGWRVLDEKGQVLADRVRFGDSAALPKEDAELVQKLGSSLATAKNANERKLILLSAFVKAGNSPETGRALGLSTTLKGLPAGKRSFVLVGMDASGSPGNQRFTSTAVDPATATSLPTAAPGLRAEIQGRGVALYWSPVSGVMPVMDYRITRDGGALMSRPYILGGSWSPDKPQYLDREAALESEHTYQVSAVDFFGRKGPAATVKVYLPDPEALYAPENLKVEAQPGKNQLSWSAAKSAYTGSVFVERAFLRNGPWENLTAKGLPRTATGLEDRAVKTGTTYFYRVRSINLRGEIGEPSLIVSAQAKPMDAIAVPLGLKAEAGTTRIRLNWSPAPRPIAGYMMERRIGAEQVWARMNEELLQGTSFDDPIGSGAYGTFSYRVRAVDFDSAISEPSTIVELTIEDLSPPLVPHLLEASGLQGKVLLRFRPAPPVEKTAAFLVLRSLAGDATELVIGDPLPTEAREFTDPWVEPGKTYQYRLVALSPKGIRSEGSMALEVLVGAPEVQAPAAPKARFVAEPFGHVILSFPEPPEGIHYFLHRKASGDISWRQLQGPFRAAEVKDVNPPDKGKVQYRLYAQSVDSTRGCSGQAVEVTIP